MNNKAKITTMLDRTGIVIDGPNPWDPQVIDDRLWARINARGSLGLSEAYMDSWWECDDLAEFFSRLAKANIWDRIRITPNLIWQRLLARFLNMQTLSRSKRVAEIHYNETEAYQATLDSRMTGSCGYWQTATNLDKAQEAKLDLICRKLELKSGNRVLDIGCGWGSFIGFAAEKYGANCVGVTISAEQAEYTRKRYQELSLEVQVKDYREISGDFDHIVSIGMFEHVGYKNYRNFFRIARTALGPDGLFLLHTIGSSSSKPTVDPFLEKYIFPGGSIPSLMQIGKSIEGLFDIVDLHSFGPDYDTTLTAWYDNFRAKWSRPTTPEEYRFYRMWRYYLLFCAGGFRARALHVWQILLSTNGVPGGRKSVRWD